MRVYCIRHYLTRNFLPQEWKSTSWWEGEKGLNPRIFTKRGAKAFVGQWVRGRVTLKFHASSLIDGTDDYQTLEIEPMNRKAETLEIVPMDLTEATDA